MATPPLGWIEPQHRTPAQERAHEDAMNRLPRFNATPNAGDLLKALDDLPVGTRVMLTDFWKHPTAVADMGGKPFTGFGQRTGSCFPGGTPVRLANGSETAVEAIQIGDEVVTHTGASRRVVNTMTRLFKGEMVTITVSGFPFPLEMTECHPVAVSDEDGGIRWVEAGRLQEGDRVLIGWPRETQSPESLDVVALLGADRVLVLDELMKEHAYTKGNEPDVPVSNFKMARHIVRRSGIDWKGRVKLVQSRSGNAVFRSVPVCPSLGRLIGLYLAEGGVSEGRAVFTFNANEESLAAEVLALVRGLFGVEGETVYQDARPNTLKVRFNNQTLAEVLKALMPGNVYSKRVPGLFFNADEETRLALLLGWMDGDGYVGVKAGKKPGNVRITGVSVCPGLARDMTTLALSCGLKATAGRRKARLQSRQSYSVDLCGKRAVALFPAVASRASGPRYTDADTARTRFGYARPIRTIERRQVETLRVFDFEVEEDHSFIAGGLVVHNCVGVSEGDIVTTVLCVQSTLTDGATKAEVCFWPFPYGRTRHNEGDRGQGEGAVDSVMGDTLVNEGWFAITEPGLPGFTWDANGLWISGGAQTEYKWSDGAAIAQQWRTLAAQRKGMTKVVINSVEEEAAAIINGYPVLTGCSKFVGHGQITGSGANAYVRGHYDGSGGHSTGRVAVWKHPTDGLLIGYSNQWDTSTYPTDPAGLGRCCVWLPESEEQKMLTNFGGNGGETMLLSHVPGVPAQPKVADYYL